MPSQASAPRLALALACASVLLGCPPRVTYPECKTDPDCTGHAQVCASGFCKQCRDDGQCKSGEICRDGGCIPKPECSGDKDCAAGLRCKQDRCAPECTEPTAATDCGQGRRCLSGRCAADEDCVADADCGDGRACVENRCRAQGGVTNASLSTSLGDCTLSATYFGYDDAALEAKAREALDQSWQCLQRQGFKRLQLAGHTDERGTTEYNLALGSRRAEAVRKYLTGLGAEARKLRTVSFGKEKPVDPGHDEAAWAKNRRVELVPEK
jgi:peptidoglycan-associated lipoprotein